MKWLVYIFSFYLLAITCLPCADMDCKEETAAVATTNYPDEHHQGDEEKSCSPFCYCSCCQTVCSIKYVSVVVAVPVQQRKQKQSIVNASLKDNTSAIWQPPRLVN